MSAKSCRSWHPPSISEGSPYVWEATRRHTQVTHVTIVTKTKNWTPGEILSFEAASFGPSPPNQQRSSWLHRSQWPRLLKMKPLTPSAGACLPTVPAQGAADSWRAQRVSGIVPHLRENVEGRQPEPGGVQAPPGHLGVAPARARGGGAATFRVAHVIDSNT